MRSAFRSSSRAHVVAGLTAVVLVAVLSGCTATDGEPDKAGGNSEPMTLRLGTPDGTDAPYADDLELFADRVDELSDGTVEVELVFDAAAPFDQESEKRLATMVADGSMDMGLVAARAWELLGVDSFRALQVPLLIDNDALFTAVIESDLTDTMLAGLDGTGVAGLTMFAESLRHPIGFTRPLRQAADFTGAKLQWNISPATAGLADVLGVRAVYPQDLSVALADGGLDGMESSFAWAHTSPRWGEPVTGNITLYAKAQTLVANADLLGDLPDDVAAVLRTAAEDTQAHAVRTNVPDADQAADYCAKGGRVVLAGPRQLRELAAVVEPHVANLTSDPLTSELVAEIRALDRETEPSGGVVDACAPGAGAATDEAASSFPEGLYRADSPADGIVMMEYDDGTWSRLFADGMVDCKATYEVRAGRIYLTMSSDPRYSCGNPVGSAFLDAAFTLDGDQLRLTDINSDPDAVAEFSLPWTRIEEGG